MSSVDVVVPCYNYGRYLGQCVASLQCQEGVDLRVLIIDDASADDTPQVGERLAAQDKRVTFRRHQTNQGHIATYNEGLLHWASAKYSLLLSADDALTPRALARATRIMDARDDVGMVYGLALILGNDSPPPLVPPSTTETRVVPGLRFLKFCCESLYNPVPTPTAVTRTATQHRLGGYESRFPHTGDLEMWIRFALDGHIGIVGEVQGYYRWHGRNMARSFYDQIIGDRREAAQTLEHVLTLLKDTHPEAEQWLRGMQRGLERQAFSFAANAFDRAELSEYRAWLEFADEIAEASRPAHMPWKLRLREAMGQAAWQRIRPGLNLLRRRAAAPWQGPRFNPSPGERIGWWPQRSEIGLS